MNDFMTSAIIGNAFSGISQLLLLIGSIIILNKQKNTASFLILFGTIAMILVSFAVILAPFFLEGYAEKALGVQSKLSILGGLSRFIFALGLLLFSIRLIKKVKE
ncbi:hypothetical protein Q4Q34_00065 [Flavivirga abyssicola]|uniref:hypothetical protein n=1 Tax=Flavivirga abyssicola TaxID=3063533 RepID=UPI0026DFCBE0|nr:hypothetical protein [Flavivirga sp. MEBiC07777]WVK13436.1 hypothetical protein Q4Q34_00065 [Flavivirga sp. MEBiC07777]